MTREEQFKTMRDTHEKMLLTKRETAKELSVSEAGMFSLDELARFLSE